MLIHFNIKSIKNNIKLRIKSIQNNIQYTTAYNIAKNQETQKQGFINFSINEYMFHQH